MPVGGALQGRSPDWPGYPDPAAGCPHSPTPGYLGSPLLSVEISSVSGVEKRQWLDTRFVLVPFGSMKDSGWIFLLVRESRGFVRRSCMCHIPGEVPSVPCLFLLGTVLGSHLVI